MRVEAGLIDIVEKRRHTIEILLRYWVVLVVMTTGAAESKTKKRGPDGGDSVRYILDAEFFFDAAALIGLPVQSIECGRQDLVAGWVRQEITGDLPGNKLVVRQILIEGPNYPIPPG